jgi:arylsulfatase A-like enzyme
MTTDIGNLRGEAGAGITRRRALMCGGLLGLGQVIQQAFPQTAAPPNVVFILADDLGWSDMGTFGSDLVETPSLDRLAKSGVKFTRAYAAAPVCSPTRASCMTGKYPARLHMTTWYESAEAPPANRKLIPPVTVADLPLEEKTIAELMHDAGYVTGHVGKWHLGSAGFYPENQGFDVNIGGTCWGAPQTHFYPYKGAKYFGGEQRYVPHLEFGRPGEYLADRLTDEALHFISKAQSGPFYLNLWHYGVHVPNEAPAKLTETYRKKIHPGLHHTNATYAAMVRNLDDNLGRVLDHLDRLGLADRTIVVFASDNGGFNSIWRGQRITDNYPLRSGKGSLYEGGIRVPLVIRNPGGGKGLVCDEPVISNDLYPTIAEMCGVAGAPASSDARSIVPLLKNAGSRSDRDALFFHYPHYYETTTPVSAIVTRDWKLLEYLEDGHCELYNLRNDISEQHDLANSNSSRVAELRERLHQWRGSVKAQMPVPNPNYRAGAAPSASAAMNASLQTVAALD